MRRFFVTLLISVSFYISVPYVLSAHIEPEIEFVLREDFIHFWSNCSQLLYGKKGSIEETNCNSTLKFEGKSLTLVVEVDVSDSLEMDIHIYDPNDPVFMKYEIPILEMRFTFEKDNQRSGYLAEVARSKNFNGKSIVTLAKSFQRFFRVEKMELVDAAISLQCPYEGKYCKNEGLMDLMLMGVMTFGKSYYESLGAIPDSENYSVVSSFLQDLKVVDLTTDLVTLEKRYPTAKKVRQVILECQRKYNLKQPNITMGQLANRVFKESKLSKEKHLIWHQFNDIVMSNKEKFFSKYVLDVLSDPNHDLELKTILAVLVKNVLDLENFELESMKEFVVEQGLEGKYNVDKLFAAYPSSFKDLFQLECMMMANNKAEVGDSPHSFSFLMQTTQESRMKTFLDNCPFEPIKEMEQLLTFAKSFNNGFEEGDDEPEESGIILLMKEYLSDHTKRHHGRSPGHLFGLWMIAKLYLPALCEFTFYLD